MKLIEIYYELDLNEDVEEQTNAVISEADILGDVYFKRNAMLYSCLI